MKGRAEKDHDRHVAAVATVEEKFEGIRALFHGLKRTRREYVAIESIDFEDIPGGQVLVLRMLYPYEMVRVELPDAQIEELINRAQGLTANGALVATPEQTAAILGNGVLSVGGDGGE
jgi:hypothetical protein